MIIDPHHRWPNSFDICGRSAARAARDLGTSLLTARKTARHRREHPAIHLWRAASVATHVALSHAPTSCHHHNDDDVVVDDDAHLRVEVRA